MTLQNDLRMYAEDMHACYGHNDYSTTMSLAADRIDELEKESNLLNVAWLQGEFSELQAKVEVLLNEHAERGVRIEELEATIRKMARDSLSVEGQWSDKVDELEEELGAKQYIIDELMIEYCPNEMTPEQWKNYEDHQRPLTDDEKKEDQECRNASS